MASEIKPLFRDIYTQTCEELLKLREDISQSVKEEALKIQDVSLSETKLVCKAEELVNKGFEKFEKEALRKYQVPPWSEIRTLFVSAAKEKHFNSSLNLLGEVTAILSGQSKIERPEEEIWIW